MQDVSPKLIVIKKKRWSLILEVLNIKIEAEYQFNFNFACLALLTWVRIPASALGGWKIRSGEQLHGYLS